MFFWNSLAFLCDPLIVSNLISGSSAFSEPSLYIWKCSVLVLLKPSLKDFEYNFTSVWNRYNSMVVWTFFGIAFLWDWSENWLVAQLMNPPAMQETWVQSLGWEDTLEEGMATHSSFLAWRIPMNNRAWRATVHGVAQSQTRLKWLSRLSISWLSGKESTCQCRRPRKDKYVFKKIGDIKGRFHARMDTIKDRNSNRSRRD